MRRKDLIRGRATGWMATAVFLAGSCFAMAQTAGLQSTPVAVDQTSRQALIGAAEVERIAAALAGDADSDWDAARVSQLRFRRVSLSTSGGKDILVRSIAPVDCGATGNCPVWAFHSQAGELRLLLSNAVGDALGLMEAEGGWRPIVLFANQSVESSAVTVYAFTGERYQPRSCYRESTHAGRHTLAPVACAASPGGHP